MFAGIDVGTTAVKVSVVDEQGHLVYSSSKNAEADIHIQDDQSEISSSPRDSSGGSVGLGTNSPHRHEQDPDKVWAAVLDQIQQIPAEMRRNIRCIGTSAQMHGVVAWSSHNASHVSSNITWMDTRTPPLVIERMRQVSSKPISAGYGCATLAAMAESWLPEPYDRVAGVGDYIVCRLCGNIDPVMCYSQAAAWGFFDVQAGGWLVHELRQLVGVVSAQTVELIVQHLPETAAPGTVAGMVSSVFASRLGLSPDCQVLITSGDHQAQVLAQLVTAREHWSSSRKGIMEALRGIVEGDASLDAIALVNVGTSAQYCTFASEEDQIEESLSVEVRPFYGPSKLVVVAGLNGGCAWKAMVNFVTGWLETFGVAIDAGSLGARMTELAVQRHDTSLQCQPSFHGERDDGTVGSYKNINDANFDLASIACATARGMVDNLLRLVPASLGKPRVVLGSGTALVRNAVVLDQLQRRTAPAGVHVDNNATSSLGVAYLGLYNM